MRIAHRALLAALVAASAPAAAEESPKLKPGLWRMTESGIAKATKMRCVTELEGQPTLEGYDLPGSTCGAPTFTRNAAGHTAMMVCQMAVLTLTVTASLRGDYDRKVRYDFAMEASEPAILAGAPPKTLRKRSTMVAVRVGDCRPG